MLATEPTTPDESSAEAPAHPTPAPLLETWSGNEKMRHIPSAAWMIQKLDVDLRRKIDHLHNVYASLPHDDPRHAPLEQELRALCRAIDRVADVARRPKGHPHPPAELGNRLGWGLSHAVQNLHLADSDTFGRRLPFQTFERSNGEPLHAAMLTVIDHVHRLQDLVRTIDPNIDERLYEGLVELKEPLRREPIA